MSLTFMWARARHHGLRPCSWHAVGIGVDGHPILSKACLGTAGGMMAWHLFHWSTTPPPDAPICPRCVAALIEAREKIEAWDSKGAS